MDRKREIKEEAFNDNTKENNENNKQDFIIDTFPSIPMQHHEEAREKALAALLMRATRGDKNDNQESEMEA